MLLYHLHAVVGKLKQPATCHILGDGLHVGLLHDIDTATLHTYFLAQEVQSLILPVENQLHRHLGWGVGHVEQPAQGESSGVAQIAAIILVVCQEHKMPALLKA